MEAKAKKRGGGLVLTRKPRELIRINGPSVVTVHRVIGGRVQLRVVAGPEVEIVRGELTDGVAEKASANP